MVYQIQKQAISFLKNKLGLINKIEYFTDGCAFKYKNCKNFINLRNNKDDFEVGAIWSFFATSHGKSACDRIGDTVKKSVALESLRRPLKQQILNLQEMLLHCKKNILSIHFQEIELQVVEETREFLQQRFAYATTIKGTRSFHNFKLLSATKIATKRINFDENYSYVFDFQQLLCQDLPAATNVRQGGYVFAIYDNNWYIGFKTETDPDRGDTKMNFMHPKRPAASFHFPNHEDVCWMATSHILYCIEPPVLATTRGQYHISSKTAKKIDFAWQSVSKQNFVHTFYCLFAVC